MCLSTCPIPSNAACSRATAHLVAVLLFTVVDLLAFVELGAVVDELTVAQLGLLSASCVVVVRLDLLCCGTCAFGALTNYEVIY